MRKIIFYYTLFIITVSCKSKQIDKPVLLNQSTIVSVPLEKFNFKATHKIWKASLLSFTQPIPLLLEPTGDGFMLSLQNRFGVTEGPAQIMLSHGNQYFYYEVHLRNSSFGSITERDYRFPKTVNPDSGLKQQCMVHRIDEWRNLVNTAQSHQYFKEEIITLLPRAGTYYPQKDKPISACYVQPGSAVSVPVNFVYNKSLDEFTVTAGPLQDAYDNTVANGTMVVFMYTDGENNYRMEAAVLNGVATAHLPVQQKTYWLKAGIHHIFSNTILLKR